MEYIELANGNKVPKLGLGTDSVLFVRKLHKGKSNFSQRLWSSYYNRIMKPIWDRELSKSIERALRMGYRLIDTSAAYHNEEAIGRAIRESQIPREQLFIQTRITNTQQYKHAVRDSFFASLKKLGLEYVDMYMIHWPVPEVYLETWKEMEKLYKEGYIRNLGVANCHQHHLEKIMSMCSIPPMIDQIEIHPLFTQKALVEYCKTNSIQVQAYSPLAQNNDRLRSSRKIKGIAEKYGKSMQQVILRWHIENGVIPIPRSTNTQRMQRNLDVLDFSLTSEEVSVIDSININSRLRYDPDNCDFTVL